MPAERPTPGTPADWLARAKSDLAIARAPLPEGALYEDLCFHAQQAAEKAIKAVYRARHQRFLYTHDLGQLLASLKQHDTAIPAEVKRAVELTEFAWQSRYPGVSEPVGAEVHREAVQIAEAVVLWAERIAGAG